MSRLFESFFLFWLITFNASFVNLVCGDDSDSNAVSSDDGQAPNILLIMLDDLGRADIGKYGAEWETPSIDSFISESISLTHHYIGFVCSASRSQFLTGRHSYHNGYGTLDVFDRAKLGGIPLGSPTIADYLNTYGGYSTYAVGKWQLGYSFDEQTPNYRGFDYFWGFYGGLEDYFDKTAAIMPDHNDNDNIKNDDTEYYDFWENGEVYDASGTYSTYQYLEKLITIIGDHNSELNSDPFFIYAALQAPHMPFPDTETEFADTCDELYADQYDNMKDRDGVCEAMLGLEYFMDALLDYLKGDDLKDTWDNTLIIFTSDNGGALSHGSCNYPLRGGKNTYFDGNQRVHAFVGGGYIPDELRGTTKTGLMANVDWMPTLMSFANLIPSDYTQVSFDNDNTGNDVVPITFDGYNMHSYIMSTDPDITPVRDHVMFQLRPALDNNSNYITSSNEDLAELSQRSSSLHSHLADKSLGQKMVDIVDGLNLDEVAMVFYDSDGKLWKYFDAEESTNEVGNPQVNCNWCTLNSKNNDNVYMYTNYSDSVTRGLYDLDTDITESDNLLDVMDIEDYKSLLGIISKNVVQYFDNDYSDSSVFLYGNFECFYDKHNSQAWPAKLNGVWAPFLERSDFDEKISEKCGFDTDHMMYKLHTVDFNLPSDTSLEDIIIDKTDVQQLRNRLAVVKPIGADNYVSREDRNYEQYKQQANVERGFATDTQNSNNISTISLMVICIATIVAFVAAHFCCKRCFGDKIKAAQTGYQQIA